MTAYETRQTRYGYSAQTTFGTAIADNAAFEEIAVEPFDFDPDVEVHDMPLAHGTRNPVEQSTVHSVYGAAAKFSLTGPVELSDIDHFLYAHYQDVIETNSGAYSKSFTFFGTAQPDFSANEGHFLTFIRRHPAASTSQKVHSAICTRLKLSGERDQFLKFESDWVGMGTTGDTSNPSGTWTPKTPPALMHFNQMSTATLTHGASLTSPTALVLQSFEIETAYEVEKLGHSASNGFENFGCKARTGNFKLKVLKSTVSAEALSSLKAGEMVQIDIAFGTTLTIQFTGKIETYEHEKEGLLFKTISGRMLSTYTAGDVGEPATIVVANSIDRNWPAA